VIARLWGLHRQVVNELQQVRRESGRDLFQQGIAEGAEQPTVASGGKWCWAETSY
jgi:hypothetical protein